MNPSLTTSSTTIFNPRGTIPFHLLDIHAGTQEALDFKGSLCPPKPVETLVWRGHVMPCECQIRGLTSSDVQQTLTN